MSTRPELQAPPEIFYNDSEALKSLKYTSSSRIVEIQAKLSERALELLALPDDDVPRFLLDIGCGSGLSGETISEYGHQWIGLDISSSMVNVAVEREVEGDLLLGDMGQGLGLRAGVIDGAISISAVQVWVSSRNRPRKMQRTNKNGKRREWVLRKKEQSRRKGNDVPADSKYTARKRKSRF
ncbi:PREDICTED: probable 18S rRNA (guanine-N(7))-methyltransferase [Brassica oleracea var. oleracea]|uniref:probable 18S rRNA (guanine-N(7))-methyltransferase n=1 Tax=Brassica oleracea var. oleracea TaxID=109376 RepID=UPI0006A6E49B|nr:PREDICTED: probable 18S rRNA (guanine-N(7))-methyltransferase [Brassica oleracea var. oleracea]